jgi:hypothetical protein
MIIPKFVGEWGLCGSFFDDFVLKRGKTFFEDIVFGYHFFENCL